MCDCRKVCDECKVKQLKANLEKVDQDLLRIDNEYLKIRKDLLHYKDLNKTELEKSEPKDEKVKEITN